jgi:predicted transcriptional regulator
MLQIDQSELAVRANLSCNVIVDFEMERRAPPANSLAAIKSAFEDAGIEFTGGGKVALRRFAKGDKVQFKQFEPHIEQRLNCNVVDDGEVGTIVAVEDPSLSAALGNYRVCVRFKVTIVPGMPARHFQLVEAGHRK